MIFFGVVFLCALNTRAAPLTSPTSEGEPSFVPSPINRGTINILLSSVVTLTLCVYTSIHLNITPEKKIFRIPSIWVYKFYWVFIALLAPEFVLYAAYIQWRNAQALCEQLRGLDKGGELAHTNAATNDWTNDWTNDETNTATYLQRIMSMLVRMKNWITTPEQKPQHVAVGRSRSRSSWPDLEKPETDQSHSEGMMQWSDRVTMVSAFFIVMGGFAYDVSDLSDNIKYLALTPEGFMEFAKAGLIKPNILNDNDITDRSKADSLAKLLVCIQAFWMVINCIARRASGLPSTLVELNVIIHVIVAIVVYALWWHKPLAVAHPILFWKLGTIGNDLEEQLATTKAQSTNSDAPTVAEGVFAAKILVQSRGLRLCSTPFDVSETSPRNTWYEEFCRILDFEPYVPDKSRFEIKGSPAPHRGISDDTYKRVVATALKSEPKSQSPRLLLLHGQRLVLKRQQVAVGIENEATLLSERDLCCLELRLSPVAAGIDNRRYLLTADPPNYSVQGSIYHGGVHRNHFDITDLLEHTALMLTSILLSCVYASCHASVWFSHFPSYIERWMWRGSCISIAAAIPFPWAIYGIMKAACGGKQPNLVRGRPLLKLGRTSAQWPYFALYTGVRWPEFVLYSSYILAGTLYVLARFFIIVEAFISIRNLPIGSFKTVAWVEYWPHV